MLGKKINNIKISNLRYERPNCNHNLKFHFCWAQVLSFVLATCFIWRESRSEVESLSVATCDMALVHQLMRQGLCQQQLFLDTQGGSAKFLLALFSWLLFNSESYRLKTILWFLLVFWPSVVVSLVYLWLPSNTNSFSVPWLHFPFIFTVRDTQSRKLVVTQLVL